MALAKTPDGGLNWVKFLIGVELPILVSNIVCHMVKLTIIVYPCLRIRQLVIIPSAVSGFYAAVNECRHFPVEGR